MKASLVLCLLGVFAAVPVRAEEAAPPPPPALSSPAEPGWDLRLGAREEYVYRPSSEPRESIQAARFDANFAARSPDGALHAVGDLLLWYEISRTPEAASGEPFALGTVYADRNPWIDALQLYAEYQGAGLLRVARAGRQEAEHGRPGTFDGLYLLTRPASRLALFAFGGRTEHFFQTSPGFFENWIASAGLSARLLEGVRLEADYRWLRESVTTDDGYVPAENHSYGATVFWRAADFVYGRVGARGLGGELSEVSGTARVFHPGALAGADLHAYVQPVELGELAELDNPFFLTLGPSFPHARWRLDLFKDFTVEGEGRVELHAGWAGRHLIEGRDSPFNRNVGRLYGLVGLHDFGRRGLFATVSLERLSSVAFPIAGKGFFAVNGSLGYATDPLRLELGTQYHRYQYVYLERVEEMADVRAFYGEVRWKPLGWLGLKARYSLEVFDRVLHSVTFGLEQTWQGDR